MSATPRSGSNAAPTWSPNPAVPGALYTDLQIPEVDTVSVSSKMSKASAKKAARDAVVAMKAQMTADRAAAKAAEKAAKEAERAQKTAEREAARAAKEEMRAVKAAEREAARAAKAAQPKRPRGRPPKSRDEEPVNPVLGLPPLIHDSAAAPLTLEERIAALEAQISLIRATLRV